MDSKMLLPSIYHFATIKGVWLHPGQEKSKIPETEKESGDSNGWVKELPAAGFSAPRGEEAGSEGVL